MTAGAGDGSLASPQGPQEARAEPSAWRGVGSGRCTLKPGPPEAVSSHPETRHSLDRGLCVTLSCCWVSLQLSIKILKIFSPFLCLLFFFLITVVSRRRNSTLLFGVANRAVPCSQLQPSVCAEDTQNSRTHGGTSALHPLSCRKSFLPASARERLGPENPGAGAPRHLLEFSAGARCAAGKVAGQWAAS